MMQMQVYQNYYHAISGSDIYAPQKCEVSSFSGDEILPVVQMLVFHLADSRDDDNADVVEEELNTLSPK